MDYGDNKPIVPESAVPGWLRGSGKSVRDFSKGFVVGGLLFSLYFFGVTARDTTNALRHGFTPEQIEADADTIYRSSLGDGKPPYHKPVMATFHYAGKLSRKPVYFFLR